MNVFNFNLNSSRYEGFTTDEPEFPDSPESNIPQQIRAVLDTMNAPGLCELFNTIRKNMAENEKVGQNIPAEEVVKRVEKALELKIPGGALPCPLFQYPTSSNDTEWLEFLKKIPADFGARVVLMAVFANKELTEAEANIRKSLANIPATEGFLTLPPNIPQNPSQQFEDYIKSKSKGQGTQENVTTLLKTLVANKITILKSNNIDPAIDIEALIAQAKKSAEFLKKKRAQVESGSLINY
jgi:hypothetical protein